jgi:uncharacterized protein YodC (DUF2158 family)
MNNELKNGAKVQLKTGGPVMVVISVAGDKAICQWQVVNRTCTQEFKIKYLISASKSYL